MIQVFRLKVAICKTLANANRLMILYELRYGERSAGGLAAGMVYSRVMFPTTLPSGVNRL